MKDEEAIDWRERFPTFHWTRRTSSRRGHGGGPRASGILCVFSLEEKGENVCVKIS